MNIKKDIGIPFLISLAVLVIGVLICWFGPFDKWLSGLYTAFLTTMTFLITSWIIIFYDLRKNVADRISNIAVFAAQWTENNSFEKTIGILRQNPNISCGVKWLVAKFISYKLNKEFKDCNDVQILIQNIDGDEYSKVLENLIYECEHEILLTCPFNSPRDWFRILEISECLNCDNNTTCAIPDIEKRIPSHIKSLISNRKPRTKIRLITSKWKSPTTNKEKKCRRNFDKLSRKAKLTNWMISNGGILNNRDLNILDSVLIEWNKETKECKLKMGMEEVKVLHQRFFMKQHYEKLP